ncbi:MAG: aminotransferase class I/II-fold pyridoxal phosphate-dependent enzyme [Duncaniella sp.]|uniref:pyridoxal phosphate-dependent aminotransferase n=1 Tax=Duncaniella sp. TaxID=2518496 RepID=UPI0023D438AF|nr:aminotransferase class I/II-fold pyridoxal phosphate-dependent enzyme [Duncaniella sp.]MDE5987777.1 aminotransferase class I/II-fold pyridoxal phosphate-dependent enzyme [Duncaniella sp.]
MEIRPSQRVENIKEYYFSTKLKEVAAMKAAGHDVISLGIGGPDRPPHKDVIDTMTAALAEPGNHGYQPHVGLPELRQAFSDWYGKWYGVELDPKSEIQPLIGSKEAVTHISLAFLNPGDGVLVPNPGYPTYSSISRLVGAEIFNYDLTEESGWQPDFDALEKLPLERIKLMWLNYPHMPTGAAAKMETFEKAIAFGKKHGIVIVNDNPYSFILNDCPMSILQIPGAKEIAIEMNSLSKSHNMPGWRVGMAASNPTFISWILKVKSNIDSGQFKPLMLAAAKALEADKSWYDEVNALYGSRRKVAEEIMTALGCSFDPTQRGLFLWGRIDDPAVSSEALADRLLHDAKVFLTPGFIFGSNGNRYIRISLCATEERMKEALQRIRDLENR